MKVGLSVPCFIDAFLPDVAIATLELLERLGVDVEYPPSQTCCGQPMANSGFNRDAIGAERLFVENFSKYSYVVIPSASCTYHIRSKFDALPQTPTVQGIRKRTFELVEFIHDVLEVREFPWAKFPHTVSVHNSCSALRSLRMANTSEIAECGFSKTYNLLSEVDGIKFVSPARPDECCGFGGTFSFSEEAVSTKMGIDKVSDFASAGADYVVSGDSSCLLHQKACAQRLGNPIGFLHIAQVLNGSVK
jgi:L-lactate dehydrogenase complex protein LldE